MENLGKGENEHVGGMEWLACRRGEPDDLHLSITALDFPLNVEQSHPDAALMTT